MNYKIEMLYHGGWMMADETADLQTVENLCRSWLAKGFQVRIIPELRKRAAV